MKELESLQNHLNSVNERNIINPLTLHEKIQDDKRYTLKKFFLQNGRETVSPCLDYNQMNHFIAGLNSCLEIIAKKQNP